MHSAQVDIKCFVTPPNSKVEKQTGTNCLLDAACFRNLPWFQGAQPDHVQFESSSCCFSRELVSSNR